MKKKLTSVSALFWALFVAFLFFSWSDNPPDGYTGSPASGGNTCSSSNGGCHSCGTCGLGNVTISGLPSNITPNTTYAISITVERSNMVAQKAGFQLDVVDGTNQNVGTFLCPCTPNPGATATSGVYFEHDPAQFFPANNTLVFTANWLSPSSATGNITMYAAANLANGNGNNDGDRIVTTTATGTLSPEPITVNMTGTNVSCFDGEDGSATATPSGGGGPPYFYTWSNGGTTQTIINLAADIYTVTVTNGSSSMVTGTITITQPASEVSVSISSQTNITCSTPTGSATAAASGATPGYTYQWSTGASGATVSSLPVGSYIVTATDGNDCTATTSVTITSNTTPPTASISANGSTTFCTGGSVTLTASGGNSYLWSTGATTPAINVLTGGTYVVTATSAANGCTDTESQAVTVHPLPTAGISGASTICPGETVTLTASGGTSFLWSTGATTASIPVSVTGIYSVTATDANSCTDDASHIVSATDPLACDDDDDTFSENDGDCNDANPAIFPGATETCNGLDDDCSGSPEAATTTWTGAGDGVNWSVAGNWSDGIVPLACQNVVIPPGMTVTIQAGFNAVGKTLDAVAGAVFQVDFTATLNIED